LKTLRVISFLSVDVSIPCPREDLPLLTNLL